MKITIQSTTKIVLVKTSTLTDGIECRVWEGTTERGVKIQALIPRIAAAAGEDLSQFEAELAEQNAPSPDVEMWPMRMIL